MAIGLLLGERYPVWHDLGIVSRLFEDEVGIRCSRHDLDAKSLFLSGGIDRLCSGYASSTIRLAERLSQGTLTTRTTTTRNWLILKERIVADEIEFYDILDRCFTPFYQPLLPCMNQLGE